MWKEIVSAYIFLENLLKSFQDKVLLYTIVTYVLGVLTPTIIRFFLKKYKNYRFKKQMEKNRVEFSYKNICSLAHGDPYYSDGELRLLKPEINFHFCMPSKKYRKILQFNERFDNAGIRKEIFFGEKSYKKFLMQFSSCIGCEDTEYLSQLIQDKKKEIAKEFLKKIKNGSPFFIGKMYGIKKMSASREKNDERAGLKIESFESDYYTHRVMAAVFQELNNKGMIKLPNSIEELNKVYPFLTSIGLNLLLIIEEEGKPYVILVERSSRLFNMTEKLWHVSVNEAVSLIDYDSYSKKISLDICAERGLREELALFEDGISDIKYTDVCYLTNLMEVGIIGYGILKNVDFSDIERRYKIAKDSVLESVSITKVELSKKGIREFLENNKTTDICQYSLQMLLARKERGDF